MRYGLESTLPINAFAPRGGRGPFARGMTLEGGGGGGGKGGGGGGFLGRFGRAVAAPVEAVSQAVSNVAENVGGVLASVDPGPALGDAASSVGSAIDSAAQNTGKFFADIDPGVKIGDIGRSVGSGLSEAGLAVGDLLANGQKYIGKTLDSTGNWVDVTVNSLGHVIIHTLHSGYGGIGDAAKDLGQVGVHLDSAVNDNVPGGWKTIAGLAATAAIPFVAPEFLASAADIAQAAGTNALKGAGVGAGTALLTGKDPVKGAISGAKMGALTGGVGEVAEALDLGSAGTKILQTAAPSLITGADPTKNLLNTAMSIGAGELGGELGVNNQISQTALNTGKALAEGKDPTKSLVNSLVGMGVGEATKTFSSVFKDALDNGMSPEQAYTVAAGTEGVDSSTATPTDTGGISNSTTDAEGNTVYNYDDGSVLTVSPDGEIVDATESTEYVDPYQDIYEDPYQEEYEDTAAAEEYLDPSAEAAPTGGLPADASKLGFLDKTLSTAVNKGTSAITSQVNKGLTSAISDAIIAPPVKKPLVTKPVVSKAQTARTTYAPISAGKPVSTLASTQATTNKILSGAAPTQATTGVMTPAERMAAIAAAFGGAAPAPKPLGLIGYAAGGTIDYTQEFIDQSTPTKYMRPGVSRGRADYTLPPGYPFGQLWRIGMAEGGGVEGHNPEFFSEGGLNSLGNTYVKGDGDGTSDSIPAMLANGEFVIPADVVSGLGNGSNDSGAKVLDEFLRTIRQHKQKTGADKLPPDSKGPLGYLLEANKKVKK
jgi:hypothetical protein